MGAKCGIASAYPSEAHEFTPGLQLGACCWIFSFYVVFVDHHCILACVLSVLRFTASDYLFGIFKKSLKMPKGQSESVYRRRTDNHNGQKKKYQRTNNDVRNILIKLKIE